MPIEFLENRKLFAVGPTATLTAGVLTIEGTSADDYVFITKSRDGDTLTVSTGIKGDAESRTKTTFEVSEITSIVVNGGDGDDTVRTARQVDLPMAIDGGAGDDLLAGGDANDAIDGGDGNDRIFGGRGDDTLVGGSGDDKVFGLDGDDDLAGGDGADVLGGGRGDDMLMGDAGNDRLISIDFDGTDTVDGGTNDTPTEDAPGDSAVVDDSDDVTNVEDVLNPVADDGEDDGDETDDGTHDHPWGHFHDFLEDMAGRFFGRGGFFRGGPFAEFMDGASDGSGRGDCDDTTDDSTDDSADDSTDGGTGDTTDSDTGGNSEDVVVGSTAFGRRVFRF